MAKITVAVDKFGDPKISVDDVQGSSCVDMTASLEAAFQGVDSKRDLKPEFDGQSAGAGANTVQTGW